ncbi:MAG: DUF1015 domain-containing protein [Calditrichia bacterium]|nr:DUF1015 domain-containing protein [Calditrichia bacterium]
MSVIKPFKGLRPTKQYAEKVASHPYDVINSEEAREIAKGNPFSFLHVNKPEIDLPAGTDLHSEAVYEQGAKNLKKIIDDGIIVQDEKPCFYIYKQVMGSHEQIGLVAGASVEEYDNDLIKKHELTRIDKENDRVNHLLSLNAQVGPVFLTYAAKDYIDAIIAELVKNKPEYDFVSDDGIKHIFWVVSDEKYISNIQQEFAQIDYLYVADGHHRSAAASRACQELKSKNPNHSGEEEYNYFLTVIFPHNQMYIMDYNRVVKDLSGLSKQEFLDKISSKFLVREFSATDSYKPAVKHDFGMYLDGIWYKLSAIPGTWNEAEPTERLDVSILFDNLLEPILGIGNPRTDKRIDFVGGIRGMQELEKRVNSGEMTVSFSLFPTSIEDLMAIADAGKTMPPKSTWFEPKLRSGLVIHQL